MNHGTIIQIDDCLVSEEVLTEFFSCDYQKCKGCCCIIGDSGAPLEECEIEAIENNYEAFSPLMQACAREVVDRDGFFEIDVDGDMVTPLVKGREECVYTHFDEEGNCFCSIERCFFNGSSSFRKPISCWLYPIRITNLSNGTRALNLHRWHICKDAFEKGRKEGIRAYQFLREPIEVYFGKDFYEALDQVAKMLLERK